MILHTKDRPFLVAQPFYCLIVQIDAVDLYFRRQGRAVQSEAVIAIPPGVESKYGRSSPNRCAVAIGLEPSRPSVPPRSALSRNTPRKSVEN